MKWVRGARLGVGMRSVLGGKKEEERRRRRRVYKSRAAQRAAGGGARSVNKETLMSNVNMSVKNDINVSVCARRQTSQRFGVLRYFHGVYLLKISMIYPV